MNPHQPPPQPLTSILRIPHAGEMHAHSGTTILTAMKL